MTVFVLTQRGPATLNSPVLDAGDGAEAVPVFTSRTAAEEYVRASGWNESDVVAELESKALLSWMLELNEDGISHVAVDPRAGDSARGRPQPVLSVRRHLSALAARLENHLRSPVKMSPPEPRSSSVRLFRCPTCGSEVEQRSGESVPSCCDRPMKSLEKQIMIR